MFTEESSAHIAANSSVPSPDRAHRPLHRPSRLVLDHPTVIAQDRRGGEPIRASVALAKRMLEAASKLVAERYSWRGYSTPARDCLEDGRAITLVAETGGATVGTLT